jgi:hypothetical protein
MCQSAITYGLFSTQQICLIHIQHESVKVANSFITFFLYFSVPLLDSYQKEQGGGTSPASYTAAFQKPQEPNIDFELDVKVFINSGKCVLHTKDPAKDDELKL